MANIKPLQDPSHRWSVADSLDLYSIERWSSGYFTINDEGHLAVTPGGPGKSSADLKALVDQLQRRGIKLPLLLRFSDILRSRIELLNKAFARAIEEMNYQGVYRGVYPIKVNQARVVVEEIVDYGRPYHYGLEAGSKPELLAVMALHQDPDALVVCNGYKDEEYIRTALMASKLGPKVVIVVEKPNELDNIHRIAGKLGVKPTIGIRARLSARGAGKWQQSGGDKSKFGLSAAEMVAAVDKLREWNQLDCLQLLHFHLGSQISNIRSIKNALREAARFYVEMVKLGCSGLQYLDVGGGLGVDYDGSQTNFASSMNYSVQEYANDVVFEIQQVCQAAGVRHPDLVSESGRAVAAHHSVLIVDVLEVSAASDSQFPKSAINKDAPVVVRNMYDTYEAVSPKNLLESFHDAAQYRDQALQLFNLGHLSLKSRVLCDQMYWAICKKILELLKDVKHVPEDLEPLERTLCDTYFLNFSMFQSLPDHWAVDQLFPIVPIHRLNERPSRRGVLADITCDSDGKIDAFIDPRDVKRVLELHSMDGKPYYLGIFLVGAYQEILGDLHNLFGDTNTVHVSIDENGNYHIEEVFPGDTVTDVLQYVNYSASGLMKRLRKNVEEALKHNRMTLEESKQLIETYQTGLTSYTYLERE